MVRSCGQTGAGRVAAAAAASGDVGAGCRFGAAWSGRRVAVGWRLFGAGAYAGVHGAAGLRSCRCRPGLRDAATARCLATRGSETRGGDRRRPGRSRCLRPRRGGWVRRLAVAWLVAGVAALVFGAPGAAAAGVSVRVGHVDQDGRVLRVLLSTSSAGLVDEVAVLSRPPARRCPRRLPGWVRVMPLRRASAVRVGLFGLDEATLAVTPRRGHVRAGRTRLCGYALRSGRTVAQATRLVAFDPRVAEEPVPPVFPWAHDVIVFGWSVFAVIGAGVRGGVGAAVARVAGRQPPSAAAPPPAPRAPPPSASPGDESAGLR